MQFYLPGDEDAWAAWEVDENGKETKMDTEARKEASIQDSKETIADYNDNDWYLAYVSINDIMDYKDFIEWFQNLSNQKELEWGALWCAVHTEDEDGYCVEPNIGFCPLPSGMSVSWTEKNIQICRFWTIRILAMWQRQMTKKPCRLILPVCFLTFRIMMISFP